MEPATAGALGPPTGRRGHPPRAGGDLAGAQKGVPAQGPTIVCIDASGVSPVPGVVRTDAQVGHTPLRREWWTRDHLSAIRAIPPEGQRYFACQEYARNSEEVVAFLEHRLGEGPGRMVIIWDGAPIHRCPVIQAFWANGTAHRIHRKRLPAYASELNPGEGLWAYLTGVEPRKICCFNLLYRRGQRRHAGKRVRREPHLIRGFYSGAHL